MFLVILVFGVTCRAFVLMPQPLARSSATTTQCWNSKNNVDKGFNLLELAGGPFLPQGALVQTAKESWKFVWKRMMAELAPQDGAGNYQRPTYSFSSLDDLLDLGKNGGTYHLYYGNPCPWCQRAVLAVYWLGLHEEIGITRLEDNPTKASRGGWIFSDSERDRLFGGCRDLRQLYNTLSPGYTGRCTAPLLVDVTNRRIVSNESADIVRILNTSVHRERKDDEKRDLYPRELMPDIDATNKWVYTLLNNGVYRCGFATTQQAYNQASLDVRKGLERCNELLLKHDYLCGNRFTEADLRLLPTILRFDGAYAPLFKAGGGHARIRDYPHLHAWLRRCWQNYPDVLVPSIDLADACESYYRQLFPLNPGGIVPYPPVSAKLLGLE